MLPAHTFRLLNILNSFNFHNNPVVGTNIIPNFFQKRKKKPEEGRWLVFGHLGERDTQKSSS
jgi:hypothetical protein